MNKNNQNELKSEAKEFIQNLLGYLWEINPSLLVLLWNKESQFSPLVNGGKIPDGFRIVRYVDCLFVKPNEFAYCKILLGHSKDKSEFINLDTEEWFKGNNYNFAVERIQARK